MLHYRVQRIFIRFRKKCSTQLIRLDNVQGKESVSAKFRSGTAISLLVFFIILDLRITHYAITQKKLRYFHTTRGLRKLYLQNGTSRQSIGRISTLLYLGIELMVLV